VGVAFLDGFRRTVLQIADGGHPVTVGLSRSEDRLMKSLAAAFLVPLLSLLSGCSAPRAMIWDGTSVPAGHVEGHLGVVGDLPSSTLGAWSHSGTDAAHALIDGGDSLADSVAYRRSARSLVAASLDMPGVNAVASLNLGLGKGFELGYRREGGANAFDLRWQFLKAAEDGWNAGVAVQYSSCDYELPSVFGDLQSFLGYHFERKDVLVPLVFSSPLGENGIYGSLGGSVIGGWTQVSYGFDSDGLYRRWGGTISALEAAPDQTSSYFSYGGSIFARLGYSKAWLFAGLTMIWQDYGTNKIPRADPVHLSGCTVLPSVGLELRL
jgi:hypothetical protein